MYPGTVSVTRTATLISDGNSARGTFSLEPR